MAANVGVIYYEVEARTAKLLDSIAPADTSVDRLGKTFSRTDRAAKEASFTMTKTATAVKSMGDVGNEAANSMGRLVRLLGGLVAIQGAGSIITMAESYNEMAERVAIATGSLEEYEMVQQRLLKTANGTYRSLAEAQEIYIQTSSSLRGMGYETESVLDITDSLSYAFVKSSTSQERSRIAMGAYSRALAKGRVDQDAWQMMLIAVPTLADDMSDSLGKSAQEIRRLGAEGKITTKELSEGLRLSLDVNKKAADDMATTVADSFTHLRNNLSVFIGEANRAGGATRLISSAVVGLGENIEVIAKGFGIIGAGALSLYIARSGAAAASSLATAVAARSSATAALQEAQARHAATTAALAAAQANAALGTNLTALTAAQKAAEASARSLAAAQVGAKAAGAGLLGILGGPAGIIALLASAGTAFYMFSDGSDKARSTLQDMGQPLDEIISKFQELNAAQRSGLIVQYTEALALSAEDTDDAFKKLLASISSVNAFRTDWSLSQWADFRKEIEAAQKAGEDLTPIIQRAARESGISQDAINTWLKLNGELADVEAKGARAASVLAAVTSENERLEASARNAAAGQRELNSAFDDASTDDYLKRLRERREAIEDGSSASKAAERYIQSLENVSPERIQQIRDEAKAIDGLSARKTAATTAAKSYNKAQEEEKRAHEQNAKTLQDMAQELAFSALKGEELAIAKANARLNSFATPEEVQELQRLASALYQVQQIEQQRQKFGEGKKADEYIMGKTDPLSGGAFDDQYARYEAEAEAEQKRYNDQLERLREARELQIETNRSYDQLEQEAAQQHADRMAQIDQAKAQVMLSSASSAFGSVADVMKQSQGEQSAIYKAMFAASKAFAIAEAIVKIQQGIANAAALPFPANIPAMAQVAAATASIVSTISSASMGGGRQYGGPVSAGKMYRINENGAPEVYNAANGQQFLLPNSRGKVVSNKDATGGGGGVAPKITVNLIEDSSRGGQVEQSVGQDNEQVITAFVVDIRGGGKAANALESTYGLRRVGR